MKYGTAWIVLWICICCTLAIEEKIIVKEEDAVFSSVNEQESVSFDPFPLPTDMGSIDHLQYHLKKIQLLEEKVKERIDQLDITLERNQSNQHLTGTIHILQLELNHIARGINETIRDIKGIKRDTARKNVQLQKALQHEADEAKALEYEEQGAQAVDYETGHLKNTTGLSSEQIEKLQAMEKRSDPAVLHYDFNLLGQIAILLSASAIGGIGASTLNLPSSVGYLLGGAVVGPSGFGCVKQVTEVETISLFGSIFILFAHGAEYSISSSSELSKQYIFGGFAYSSIIIIFCAMSFLYLQWTTSAMEGVVLGVAVCLSSNTIIFSFLRHSKLVSTTFRKAILSIIVVQDAIMSFALALPEILVEESVSSISYGILKSVVSYLLVIVFAFFLHRYVVGRIIFHSTHREQFRKSPLVLLSIVSICLSMALLTEAVGLSLECGAFFAGLAFIGTDQLNIALTSIQVLDNLFGSMFFACIGMLINPLYLLRNSFEILMMVLLICVGKTFIGMFILRFYGASLQSSLNAGLSLSQVGEFAIVFMIKAHSGGLLSRRLYLLFLATTSVFLGTSSLLHKAVLSHGVTETIQLPSFQSCQP